MQNPSYLVLSEYNIYHFRWPIRRSNSPHSMHPTTHRFDPDAFPGYEHTMTNEDGSALSKHDQFSTWVFRVDE